MSDEERLGSRRRRDTILRLCDYKDPEQTALAHMSPLYKHTQYDTVSHVAADILP